MEGARGTQEGLRGGQSLGTSITLALGPRGGGWDLRMQWREAPDGGQAHPSCKGCWDNQNKAKLPEDSQVQRTAAAWHTFQQTGLVAHSSHLREAVRSP